MVVPQLEHLQHLNHHPSHRFLYSSLHAILEFSLAAGRALIQYHERLYLKSQPLIPTGIFDVAKTAFVPELRWNYCISVKYIWHRALRISCKLAHLQRLGCSELYGVCLIVILVGNDRENGLRSHSIQLLVPFRIFLRVSFSDMADY
jgi:hypothetical protein